MLIRVYNPSYSGLALLSVHGGRGENTQLLCKAALSCLHSHSASRFNYSMVIFPWQATSTSQN